MDATPTTFEEQTGGHRVVTLVDDIKNNHLAWLDARQGRIGSSDIAIIAGLNPYKTRLHLWSEYTGKMQPANLDDNDAVWLGTELEPTVAKMYERKTRLRTVPFNRMVSRTDLPWAHATPDYLIEEAGCLLECKTTGHWKAQEWEEKIPDAAHLQVHWQMGISCIHGAVVAALIGGREFVKHEVAFDPDIFEQLVEMGHSFLKNVKEDIPPPATALDKDLLTQLNGKPVEHKAVQLTCFDLVEKWTVLDASRRLHDTRAKELKEEQEAVAAQIRQQMGDAMYGNCANWQVSAIERLRKPFHSKGSSWIEFKVKEVMP